MSTSFANTKPALLLIDVQQGFVQEDFFGGNRNNPEAEAHCGQLLDKAQLRIEQLTEDGEIIDLTPPA